jgi:hypothetical protein
VAPASGRGPAAGEGQAECLLKFETVAAIVCRVHDANLFYRVEKKTGIEPCGRLVERVMSSELYASAVFAASVDVREHVQRVVPMRAVPDRD